MEDLITATTIYSLTIVVLTIGVCIGGILARRQPPATKRMILVSLLPAAGMAVGYIGLTFNWVTVTTPGGEESLLRFVGYSMLAIAVGYLAKELLSLTAKQGLIIAGVYLLFPWAALLGWLTTGIIGTLASVGSIASVLLAAYWMFGPTSRIARDVGGDRYLLFAKLRNHTLLCMSVLVVLAMLSAQNMGVLTSFSGALGASYTDFLLTFGIIVFTFLEREAFQENEDVSVEASGDVDDQPQDPATS